MKTIKYLPIVLILAFYSCIGTDIVEEVEVPVDLSISRSVDSIAVGGSFTFQADYFNMFGQKADVNLNWSSSDPAVVTVDGSGVANAVMAGRAYIRASFAEVIDSVEVVIAETVVEEQVAERMGTLMGVRNYTVNGGFTLRESGSNLELEFDQSFRASNGPGLFVYLSNSTNSVSGGVELGRLMRNSGSQTYTISMTQAQLNTYDHVIIYCKPFGVAFGFGTFSN